MVGRGGGQGKGEDEGESESGAGDDCGWVSVPSHQTFCQTHHSLEHHRTHAHHARQKGELDGKHRATDAAFGLTLSALMMASTAIAVATAQGMVCDVLRADSTGTVHDDTLYTSYVRPVPDLFGPCPATPEGRRASEGSICMKCLWLAMHTDFTNQKCTLL